MYMSVEMMVVRQSGLLLILFVVLQLHLRPGFGFNLDLKNFVVRSGQPGSQFGFSVAQYIDITTRHSQLLVGAPSMQTVHAYIIRGGAVLRCPLDDPLNSSNCLQIPFDQLGNNKSWNGRDFVQIENKTLQWFGATLVTSKSGHVLACAPRYVYFSRNGYDQQLVGSCYLSQSNLSQQSFTRYSPCTDTKETFCQNGFSAAFSSDGNHFVTGAVGGFFWQGQMYRYDRTVIDQKPLISRERSVVEDSTYMGYAVAAGSFESTGSQDFVVGVPKGNYLTGKILFLSSRLEYLYELVGEQIGEYFGNSVAVADFNGDGLDDVAVGAPFYSSGANQYDVGRVYVFYQTDKNIFVQDRATRLSGSRKALGRFGFAVSRIGDLSLDGYGDLAVGAPYDGPNGNGAVYIFHGSISGVRKKESQVCFAEAFGPRLSSFGFSLSGGLDLDKNGYPDLLVGAYKSDSVVYLKSRPVVKVSAKVKVNPEIINLDDKSCRARYGTLVACFSVTVCADYSGVKVPPKIQLVLSWRLDTWKSTNQRAMFIDESLSKSSSVVVNTTLSLQKQHRNCTSQTAHIKESIRDKLSPIEVSVGYALVETVSTARDLRPVLDIFARNPITAEGHILKNCGPDRICIPDLVLQVDNSKGHYVLGSDEEVNLNVTVKNFGEDAFESIVKVDLPKGVSYINIINMTGPTEVTCDSFRPENSTADVVFCDIGNPLRANDSISFVFRLMASGISPRTTVLQFSVLVNSSNPERPNTFADNSQVFEIPAKVILNIMLAGVSQPEQVLYDHDESKPTVSGSEIGPNITHLFEIRNFGPGIVGSVRTVIDWPSSDYEGRHLFYLLEQPRVILGSGTCWTDAVNPLNLTVLSEGHPRQEFDLPKIDLDETRVRRKRDLAQTDLQVQKVVCRDAKSLCSEIKCDTGTMKKGDSVLIQIRAQIFFRTIIEMQKKGRGNGIVIQSHASANVTSVPYAVQAKVYLTDKITVATFVSLGGGMIQNPIEIWMIAVGIFAGCIALLLLVTLLWRCGFFQRSKRMELQRAQMRYQSFRDEPTVPVDYN